MPTKEEEAKAAAGSEGAEAKTGAGTGSNGAPKSGESSGVAAQGQGANAQAAAQDAIAMLKADHRKVEQLFAQYEGADSNRKKQIVQDVCRELITHTILEEEIFYPACRKAAS